MWCISTLPRTQRRTVVEDVATPPDRIEMASSPVAMGAALSSLAWTTQPPSGGGPATAMSPPRLTSTPVPSPLFISNEPVAIVPLPPNVYVVELP